MAAKPISVAALLPHPALPAANWVDRYEIRVDACGLTAMDAARIAVGHFPPWVKRLMTIRNAAGRLVGLKPSTHHSPTEIEMIGIFPIVSRSDREVVLGFDDRHLDFRIVIDVRNEGVGQQIVSAMTLVNRKILLGRFYIAVVTPFHKLIVATMLTNLGKKIAADHSIGVVL